MRLNSNAILGRFGIIFSILKNVSTFNLAPHWLLMIASPDLGGHPILSGSGYALFPASIKTLHCFPEVVVQRVEQEGDLLFSET